MEVLSTSPYIVFDGAHNALAMEALAEWLSQDTTTKKWFIYINVLKDRQLPQFVGILLASCRDKIEKIYFFPVTDEEKDRFYSIEDDSSHDFSHILDKVHSLKGAEELTSILV